MLKFNRIQNFLALSLTLFILIYAYADLASARFEAEDIRCPIPDSIVGTNTEGKFIWGKVNKWNPEEGTTSKALEGQPIIGNDTKIKVHEFKKWVTYGYYAGKYNRSLFFNCEYSNEQGGQVHYTLRCDPRSVTCQ